VISYFYRKRHKERAKNERAPRRTLSEGYNLLQTDEWIQFHYILELFKRLEAPQYFNQIFKYVPKDFTERIMKFIIDNCTQSASAVETSTEKKSLLSSTSHGETNTLQKIFEKIDRNLLEGIVRDFQRLAERYLKVNKQKKAITCV
jgi:uncharacterized secreted protein with C-terminal beta-propeller domain